MLDKVKVLFIHTGAELYGSDRILSSIITNIDKNSFEPIVVLPSDGPLVLELRKNNIDVRVVAYPVIRRKIFNIFGLMKYLLDYKRSCSMLLKIVKDENISIIHNNTIAVLEGVTLKKKSGAALITHVHEMVDRPKLVASFLYNLHYKHADEVVCVSNAVARRVEKYTKKKEKITVIHNGIEPTVKNSCDFRSKYGIPETAKLVAVIGRINAIKGQNDFIDAIKRARLVDDNIYGIIVGDAFSGQEWRVKDLCARISSEGLDNYVKYIGFVKDTSKVYSAIDALVLPSIGSDSFPTVVIEAMSCGIPTIAYKSGGVEEMIDNGKNGYLIDCGDVDALSERIVDIDSNKMRSYTLEKFHKNFDLAIFIKCIQKEYSKMALIYNSRMRK